MNGLLDVVVIGGGIVGIAHAIEAADRGLSVALIERDDPPVGASIRNFGHACVTAQAGDGRRRALRARERWVELAARAGFWAGETGTVVVARAADELAVLHELAAIRGPAEVELLDASEVRSRVGSAAHDIVGGARFRLDLRVNPREAAHSLLRWLAGRPGVAVRTGEHVVAVEPGVVRTNRATLRARRIVVAVNHDVDRLFPDLDAQHGVRRCWLQMLQVAAPGDRRVVPGVLSGFSLLRYAAFGECGSLGAVRARLTAESPLAIEADLNLMFTQLPDGDLLLGDTHGRGTTIDPFCSEAWFELVLAEGARLLGVEGLAVRERWQGVYASAPEEFLVAEPMEGVTVASVTSGIGMTTGFGLAAEVADGW